MDLTNVAFLQQQNLDGDLASKINFSTQVASTVVHSKAVVMLFMYHGLVLLPLIAGCLSFIAYGWSAVCDCGIF